MKSIRRRLLLLQLTAVILISGLGVAGVYYRVRDLFYELQDSHLEQIALLLLQQSEQSVAQDGVLLPGIDDLEFIGQVWDESGKLIYSSHRGYSLPRPPHDGLQSVIYDEDTFRAYALSRHAWTVQVAQSLELREDALHSITLRLLAPLALIVPLLGFASWAAIGRGLYPLSVLRREVAQRSSASLTPIALEHAPEEVRPLIGALNDLLARLEDALDSQRQFTADAAHELRTPLTGVKLQFQLLERAATEQDRERAVDNLKEGIDRAIRLVQQLLTLARLEPEGEPVAPQPVSLARVASRVVQDFEPHAQAKSIALEYTRQDAAQVLGDEESIRTLINNLVDNAIRYTPRGGHVRVTVRDEGAESILQVEDSGSGIPLEQRERVFDRFYRVEGTSEPGSGLGLSIVRRVAQTHGAHITLDKSPLGGLIVRVGFPSGVSQPRA